MGGEVVKGKIKNLIRDRGFGFITTEAGKDVFFHRSDLEGVDFEALREGISVEFALKTTPRGLQAVNVTSEMTPPPVITLQAYSRPYVEQIDQLRQERDDALRKRDEALTHIAELERELGRLEERLEALEHKRWWERLLER
jgi:CspA family cold shock protein